MSSTHLGYFLNSAQLACTAKFKMEPKCAAVKLTPLTEVIKPFKLLWRTHWLQWIMIGWSYRKLVLQEDWFWLTILSAFNVTSFSEIDKLPLVIVFVILAYKLETPKCFFTSICTVHKGLLINFRIWFVYKRSIVCTKS